MLNGHWGVLAVAGAIKQALPLSEWVRVIVVAVVTAVLTMWTTTARLDERIVSIKAEISEIKRDVDKIESTLVEMHKQLAGIKR